MSRQKAIHDYIQTKLSANSSGLGFNLYYKYGINDGEFHNILFNSVNLPNPTEENEVDVIYDGVTYQTQNGQYTLDRIQYIPCIIEAFEARFEPLDTFDIVEYTIPISFFVEERFNKQNNDIVTDAIESIQSLIRGKTDTIGGYNTFITHSAFSPVSGIIEIGSANDSGEGEDIRYFRTYQMTIYLSMNKQGYFGKEIQYKIQNTSLFSGVETRIYPIGRNTARGNETQDRQKFNTLAVEYLETKSVPDISSFTLELTFLYDGTEFPRHLVTQKYSPTKPLIYFISVTYPGIEGTPFGENYILTEVLGTENVDDKLLLTCTFIKASEEYNG